MKRFLLLIYFSPLITIIFAGTTGKLTGTVTDAATGEPLPFVNIILEETTLGTATDINGKYVILNIPPGKYNIRYQYIGYQTVMVENIVISIDLTTTQDVQLEESAVEIEEVVVQGRTEALKKDITSSQSLISAEKIESLPVAEFDDVLQLQAGVTRGADGSFHIRGGRSSEVAYWVNGISITDSYDKSRGIEIDNSSIQELQVISGTFNAEFGDAMSGIVNTVTKEGGAQLNGNVKLYGSDFISNFTEYFTAIDQFNPLENYNIQASLSGTVPFTNKNLKFFVNGRYNSDEGYLYGKRKFLANGEPGDGEVVAMNWSKRFIGQANLSYWITNEIKLMPEFLFSTEDYQDYNHEYKWAPDGNTNKFSDSYIGTFSITHMLSSSTFYTLKVSDFFRKFEEYLYEDPYDSRYLHPDFLSGLPVYSFRTKGTNLYRQDRETNIFLAKLDFSSQVSENHLVKLGAEVKLNNIKFDAFNLVPLEIDNEEVIPFVPDIPDKNELTRDKYEADPFELSAYIQDKIEFESVIINIGLRFDYFDSRGNVLVDPEDPNIYAPLRLGLDTLSLAEREPFFYKDAAPKWQFSPRFGIAYPISATGVLHFSYGHFLQVPSFQYLFNRSSYKVPRAGDAGDPYGNPDLEPQRTVMYEIGFRQELMDVFLVDVTAFYRDIRNWITAGPKILTRNGVTYSMFINKDYSNVRGITLSFNKQLSNYYSFDLNYTFQVADGSNSSPEDEFRTQQANNEPALFLLPLDWDQRHLLNFSVYLSASDWGVSLIARYGTGLPYTPSITQYIADRGITSGIQRNSRRRPTQFNLDLRLHKTFKIFDLDVTTFLRVFNLLDTETVVNVFADTGEPGFTTEALELTDDPNRPNTREEFFRMPWHYARPRLVEFGFEFSF